MSVRTTERAVKGLLLSNYDNSSNPSLQPFIDTAASLVDRIEIADDKGSMSSSSLELVERYLSAHFYAHADPFLSSKSTGGASGQFQGRTDVGFDATLYGQTAKRLDVTGTLVTLDQPLRPKASCNWLGLVRDDQTDVDGRTT